MSQENVERLRRVFETFNRLSDDPASAGEHLGTLLAFYDPSVIFEPRQAALQGTYRGHEGLTQWLVDIREHYEAGRMDFFDIRDVGGQAVALGTLRARGRSSGIETDTPLAIVATFREGLIVHLKDYGEHGRALEAVGLREEDLKPADG